MVNWRVKPGRMRASGSPSRRSRRTQNEWNVDTFADGDRADIFQQRSDAFPHLFGGFIGECHGQIGEGGTCVRDDVRDAMRNDPGLAAAGAGQDQQRTFGVGNGFALLGFRPLRKSMSRETRYILARAPRCNRAVTEFPAMPY